MTYLGEDIKKLGFGLMRLPRKDGAIDLEQTKEMVDLFLNAGFTYFDTAWAYEGSEEAVRKALVERYPRERFQLATKNAAWLRTGSREEAEAQLEVSLERTGAGYFDFYLLHNLGRDRTKYFENYDLWNFAQKKKADGLIRHLGFSFHSTPEELEKILTDHPEAEFVQLQINYADWNDVSVQSRACYETACRFGKPVIIMEPVKGGMLANPPETVKKLLLEAEPDASLASWGIRFAADKEGIITVLSGMSSLEQVQDNLTCMKDFSGLTPEEQAVIEKAQAAIQEIPLIPCTGCNYCAKVCPANIGISCSFESMNIYTLYGLEPAVRNLQFVENDGLNRADQCLKCGQCEQACPQQISIRKELEKVAATLLA